MRNDMKRFLALAALLATIPMIGCGPPSYLARMTKLNESGQCDAAESEVIANEYNLGRRATALGAIASDCRRDREAAVRYLTLGARYGEPFAQQWLTGKGFPVPPADLKGKDTTCFSYGRMISCSSE